MFGMFPSDIEKGNRVILPNTLLFTNNSCLNKRTSTYSVKVGPNDGIHTFKTV